MTKNSKPKVALRSLGCPKNEVDAEAMLYRLLQDGFEITDDMSQADVIIVNTCGFIGDAAQESVDAILEAAQYKETGQCSLLVASGCLTQRYASNLMEQLPEVDLVLGTSQYPLIAEHVRRGLEGKRYMDCAHLSFSSQPMGRVLSRNHYAYLKIAEGCDNHCTYCTIPSIKGSYESRAQEDIVAEAHQLVEGGISEVILIAQDTTRYGMDRYQKPQLPSLLRDLSKVDGLRRIRLLYCYPELVSDELLDTIAALPQVCNYLDVPLQHIDDGILKRMGRRSGEQQIRELVEKIRNQYHFALRTTFIVGFPGEDRAAFAKLARFVQESRFDHMGAFQYSPEDGTPAAVMEDQVPNRTKQRRYDRLMQDQQSISAELLSANVGKYLKVLVENKVDKDTFLCRSEYQSPEIDGCVYVKGRGFHSGEYIDVEITQSDIYDMRGKRI